MTDWLCGRCLPLLVVLIRKAAPPLRRYPHQNGTETICNPGVHAWVLQESLLLTKDASGLPSE